MSIFSISRTEGFQAQKFVPIQKELQIESAKKSLDLFHDKPTRHLYFEYCLSTCTYCILQTGKGTVFKALQ